MADTIPARLFAQAAARPAAPAYHHKVDGEYRMTSWAEYAAQVRAAGRSLLALGFEPGQITTILGFNRPEWVILDVATMAAGGAPAGIYATSSPDEVQYIVGHAESPLILVENAAQIAKVLEVRDRLPHLKTIVTMEGAVPSDDPMVLTWTEFLEKGSDVSDADLDARIAALEPDGLATLIYTSGTTGPPKGVMLTHKNLTWTAAGAMELLPLENDDRTVSYLPLSHIAEQMFSIHLPITVGWSVYYAESIEKLAENLKEVRPTIFFAVPRVWEKFHAAVSAKLAESTGIKHKIGAWAQGVGRRHVDFVVNGRTPPLGLKIQHGIANALAFKKVKDAMGLDKARIAATSAAPISQEILEFFAGFDLPIVEIYGQSEGTGPTTANGHGAIRFGSVGKAFPGCEVKVADDGEILLKGGNVFAGYYKDARATADTLVDGWLHSGDLGSFDDDGFLYITGRKKDIIITAGGKNIAPSNLELAIKDNLLVSEAVVIGDRRKYLTALITLDAERVAEFAAEHGISGPVHHSDRLQKEIQATIDGMNDKLARVEQVKKFTILPRELTIDDGELTGTLKVKRNVVSEHFSDVIDGMYAEEG